MLSPLEITLLILTTMLATFLVAELVTFKSERKERRRLEGEATRLSEEVKGLCHSMAHFGAAITMTLDDLYHAHELLHDNSLCGEIEDNGCLVCQTERNLADEEATDALEEDAAVTFDAVVAEAIAVTKEAAL